MASPQCENGYIRFATELWKAICSIRIPGEARQVFDFIAQKTYGFNKKEDAISLSQFVVGTGIKKPDICQEIKRLKSMNLICQKANDIVNIYSINKDFQSWKPLPKKQTFAKKQISICQKANESFAKKLPTIDNIQKTVLKDIALPPIISQEDWNKWVEHRKKQKKPMTEYAKELAIGKLTRLNQEGHCPKDVIEHSIENNYQGLFSDFNKKQVSKNEFGY